MLRTPAQNRVAYVEEIQHPAMNTPLIAEGWFRRGSGQKIFRDQKAPIEETAILDDEFVTVLRGDEPPEIAPIPAELKPMIAAVAALMDGDIASQSQKLDPVIIAHSEGWRLSFKSEPTLGAFRASMIICGESLIGLEFNGADQSRRLIRFSDVH